jgi:hypothetical protein
MDNAEAILIALRAVERSGGIHWQLAGNAAELIDRLRCELTDVRDTALDIRNEWKNKAEKYYHLAHKEHNDAFEEGYQVGVAECVEQRDAALASVAKLREALERITQIEDDKYADDWAEIEEARSIARAVLEETKGDGDA